MDEFTSIIQGTKSLIEGIQTLWQYGKTLKNIKIDEAILSIREQVLDLQKDLLETKEKYQNLAIENRSLHEKLKLQGELTFKKAYYFRRLSDGSEEGPYCPTCLDDNHKFIRLHLIDVEEPDSYYCKVCKNHHEPPEVTHEKREKIRLMNSWNRF